MSARLYTLPNGRQATDCPICRQAARVDRHGDGFRFHCYGGCSDEELAGALPPEAMLELAGAVQAKRNGHGGSPGALAVTFTDHKPPRLQLPDVPAHDDPAALARWLTAVLALDPAHPVTGAVHQGVRGADGHVEIHRLGAPAIRFEPAGSIGSARKLLAALPWQLIPTDAEPYGFKDEHARRIAHVVRLLCGTSGGLSENEETAGIVGAFLAGAQAVEGHTTHGTSGQRYEAAVALQTDATQAPRFLIDEQTGELAIRVSDLHATTRFALGSSVPRGWLDGRMDGLGWRRCRLDGHALSGRSGRTGPHARVDVYRGHLPASVEDEAVTT